MQQARAVRDDRDRRWPGRPRSRLPPASRQGRSFVILDAQRARRRQLASALGLLEALLAGEPRRPPGHAVPRAGDLVSDRGRDGRLPREPMPRSSSCRCAQGSASTLSRRRTVATSPPAGGTRFEADNVVIATGVFQKPHVPEFASELDPSITQLHSSAYRNLSQLQEGNVLVVGASHSGSDIAFEAASTHEVVLSGRDTGQLPAPVESRRGRFLFRGLFFVGTHVLTVDTPPAGRCGRTSGTAVRRSSGTGGRICALPASSACSNARLASTAGCPCSRAGASSRSGTSSGAPASARTTPGSASRSSSVTTGSRCSTAASSRRRPACTSSGCRSCTRSRRC